MILYGDTTPSGSGVADISSWGLDSECRLPADDRSGASRAMIVNQRSEREEERPKSAASSCLIQKPLSSPPFGQK